MLDPVAVIRNVIHGGIHAHVHSMHQLPVRRLCLSAIGQDSQSA